MPTYAPHQARAGYVWRPALLYGGAYLFFALGVKLLSSATQAQAAPAISGFAFGLATVAALYVRRGLLRRRRQNGPPVRLTAANLSSSFACCVIVVTTALAYTFDGVSILLALLLMRIGVLILAPIIDFANKREVRPASLAGVLICIGAALLTLFRSSWPTLPTALQIVLTLYLLAYFVRLGLMTRFAKTEERAPRGDWFIVETGMVAAASLVVALASLVWSVDTPDAMRVSMVGAFAGATYGLAFVQGTLIYLDWRENTLAVGVNRSASLLAGMGASLVGAVMFGFPLPASPEWIAAALVLCALGFLGVRTGALSSLHKT